MGHDEDRRPTVVLFHSMFGLRPVELAAAAHLRTRGYRVIAPDLYAGATAGRGRPPTPADGFALMAEVGWETIVGRARAALRDLPSDAVLCGMSMGAGVVGAIWPNRPDAAAVVLLHAATAVPPGVRPGTPVQLHIASDDRIAPPRHLDDFRASAGRAPAMVALHRYDGAGHFFTDDQLPDYNEAATALTWQRVDALLGTIHPVEHG